MILYRKAAALRVRRSTVPEPPFWTATAIAPYSARRAEPVAIDYLTLSASSADRLEVTVCDNLTQELDRARSLAAPLLIDAAEAAEIVFRRGDEALEWSRQTERPAVHLVSTRGALPRVAHDDAVIVIAAWPLELTLLEPLFAEARERGMRWGVAVPVIFPCTTELPPLASLADAAAASGAAFLAAIGIEVAPTAKQAIAGSLGLAPDDDRYATLFHGRVEPIHLATERHIAALAHERGLADFVIPPRWEERSNWNAASLLTRTASRMIAMELDLDLAGVLARSARAIAELAKPLTRVAEAASLSIIGGLDEVSVEILTEWIDASPPSFVEYIDEQWRLARG